jgi:hypothetical protein
MSILITTEILGENSVLTSVDCQLDLSAAWIRSGDGLIGFGEYKKVEISGADRFKQARTWWYLNLRSRTMFMVVALDQCFLPLFHLINSKTQSW